MWPSSSPPRGVESARGIELASIDPDMHVDIPMGKLVARLAGKLAWPEPGTVMHQPIDFRSPDFLRAHILDTMAFYDPVARDPSGGFFHFFKDDGTVYDRQTRHLVSSARFVFNHASAFR